MATKKTATKKADAPKTKKTATKKADAPKAENQKAESLGGNKKLAEEIALVKADVAKIKAQLGIG